MRIQTRFSIKSLLLLTGIVALVLTLIRYRPSPEIRVTVYSNGRVTLQDEPIETETLRESIDRERTWRKLWIQTSEVTIVFPRSFLVRGTNLRNHVKYETFDELTNPLPEKLLCFQVEDIMAILKQHKLSDLENIVISEVNSESSSVTNAR